MSGERKAPSRRDLFRIFGKGRAAARASEVDSAPPAKGRSSKQRRSRARKRPPEPVFHPLPAEELEGERRQARELLGEVPEPAERPFDPTAFWKGRRK